MMPPRGNNDRVPVSEFSIELRDDVIESCVLELAGDGGLVDPSHSSLCSSDELVERDNDNLRESISNGGVDSSTVH